LSLSIDDKAKIFEFHKLFKANPQSVTPEITTFIKAKNEELWQIKGDEKLPVDARVAAFDMIKLCHEMLGRKFDESWKPKEGKKGGGNWKPLTKEQRAQNCKDFIDFMKSLGVTVSPESTEWNLPLAMIWGPTK